jgi:hypothetical protein
VDFWADAEISGDIETHFRWSVDELSPPPQSTVDLWAEAIISGDIETLRTCHFRPIDTGHPLPLRGGLLPKPKYSRKVVNVPGPTLLIWAVECEQLEVLEYLFAHVPIRLDATSRGGLNAIHVAAQVSDPRPLDFLLRYQFYQENIDLPFPSLGQPCVERFYTTALHVAVAQHNVPHVFLLLTQRTTCELLRKKVDETDPTEPLLCMPPANPDQQSAYGATALHIAIQNGDLALVRVLMSFGTDPEILNRRGETALQIAERVAAEKDRTGVMNSRTAARRRIIEYVRCEVIESPEDLIHELAPEIAPARDHGQKDRSDEDEDGDGVQYSRKR